MNKLLQVINSSKEGLQLKVCLNVINGFISSDDIALSVNESNPEGTRHVSPRLEREKVVVSDVDVPDSKTNNPVLARRAARKRELQESWGGISFGNSIHLHVWRIQRDKAASL